MTFCPIPKPFSACLADEKRPHDENEPLQDVGAIRSPFAVGSVRMELAVQQIFVFMYLLPHIHLFSVPSDLRKQTVFPHDTQDGLGIAVDA